MKRKIRAIIVKDGSVLLIHRVKETQGYWVFPGGSIEGQDVTDAAALQREAEEELGVQVEVGELFTQTEKPISEGVQVESFYLCQIVSGVLGSGQGPEFQSGTGYEGKYLIEWLPIAELDSSKVLPQEVSGLLKEEFRNGSNSIKRS